jgi:Uncharacterized protein conserved in bacteria (DUF2325)
LLIIGPLFKGADPWHLHCILMDIASEQDNAALVERLDRQQKQSRADVAERDRTIHRLNEQLSQKLIDEQALVARANDADNFLEVIRELEKRLDEELPRRDVLERNLALVSEAYEHAEHARSDAEQERDALRHELATVEAQLNAVLQGADDAGSEPLDLSGLTVLYVGGRAKQVRQLKSLVERLKGELLHHDAGVEHSLRLLPGLVSRAAVAVFPVDCVSHDAVASIKRLCHQIGRPYLPLRTSSLTCLLSALTGLRAQLLPQTLQ